MNSKRKLIVGVLAFFVVMTMGYALFSETVTIGGTAKADGNLSLDFVNPDGTTNLNIKTTGVGYNGTAKIDDNHKTLKINANFDYPTAYIEIPVKVKNTGNIDLYVEDINISGNILDYHGDKIPFPNDDEGMNNSIYGVFLPRMISYNGISKGNYIKSGESKDLNIKLISPSDDGHPSAEGIEDFTKFEFNITITGIQEINDNNTNIVSPVKYAVGDEIFLGTEKFNIIKDNGDTLDLFARYNVTSDLSKPVKQTDSFDWKTYYTDFLSKDIEHEFDLNPNFPDLEGYSTYPEIYPPIKEHEQYNSVKKILDKYNTYLISLGFNVNNLRPITMTELGNLGCGNETWQVCDKNPKNRKWLHTEQTTWTSTMGRDLFTLVGGYIIYSMDPTAGDYYLNNPNYSMMIPGIRPVITINKSELEK